MVPHRVKRPLKILRRRRPGGVRPVDPQVQPAFPSVSSWFQAAGQSIHDRGLFVGCPLDLFELTARDPLCVALMEGLNRSSSVLEVGCGCLRVGYWFIQFLDSGRYCGIEPAAPMLQAGREIILGPLDAEKSPRFSTKRPVPVRRVRQPFDFVMAFSIWSHASKVQVEKMLDAFTASGNPGTS